MSIIDSSYPRILKEMHIGFRESENYVRLQAVHLTVPKY